MCVYLYRSAGIYVGKDQRWEFSSVAFHLIFWDKVCHWTWSLSPLAGSYGRKLLVSICPASLTFMRLLCKFSAVWTQFSCVHSKHFTYWATFLAPISLAREENVYISMVWSMRQFFSVIFFYLCHNVDINNFLNFRADRMCGEECNLKGLKTNSVIRKHQKWADRFENKTKQKYSEIKNKSWHQLNSYVKQQICRS